MLPVNAETAIITNPVVALSAFCGVIALLLFLVAHWKWHVFLALLVPLLLFGILPGVQANNFILAFETGFGRTLGSIGVVIVLGSIIAEALRHTGSIRIITGTMVSLVGAKRMPLALTLAGFILGIAIFSDVAYVILNPLVHSAAKAMGVTIGVTSIGLVTSLQLTHAIVPPTPGPLAAAALLGADIGKTIIFGAVACIAGSLAGWIWGQFVIGPRIKTLPSAEFASDNFLEEPSDAALPGVWRSYAPIVVPVLLIAAQSASRTVLDEGHWLREGLVYIGWPVVALSVGVWLAYGNIRTPEHRQHAKTVWIEDGLRASAMILVVTGLGGALSEVLRGTPAVEYVSTVFMANGLPAILLPFAIGIIGNMITGSTTVGVITAASLVAPMLTNLNLSPEAAVLSGACGSVIIKYVNSSYFWICTTLSGMRVSDAILAYGGGTLIAGLVSYAVVVLLWINGAI